MKLKKTRKERSCHTCKKKIFKGESYGQKSIEVKIRSRMNLKQNKDKTYEEIKSIITDNHRSVAAG